MTRGAEAVSGRGASRNWSLRRRQSVAFYICISPLLLGVIAFVAGPMFASLGISLTMWDLPSPARFVGLDNYVRMVTRDPRLLVALKVTVTYTLAYVPTELAGGLIVALLMNQARRGIRVFRAIYSCPRCSLAWPLSSSGCSCCIRKQGSSISPLALWASRGHDGSSTLERRSRRSG